MDILLSILYITRTTQFSYVRKIVLNKVVRIGYIENEQRFVGYEEYVIIGEKW